MELNIKILEINPSIKNLKISPSDTISLSFIAENVVVKIDDLEKNITNKENILLVIREYSPNEKIHFNLIRNDAIIIGAGKFTPLSGIKWYKMFDLISLTETNVNYSSKNLFKKSKNNNDSLVNSNIKIKLETQINIVKSKSKSQYNTKKLNFSGNKNQSNLNGIQNPEEKTNNSIISSNLNSNFNKFKINQNINSYTATPNIKSPRYTNIVIKAESNTTNNNDNNNNSSREDTLKENNILPALDLDKEKIKKSSVSRRTPSGKKYLGQTKKYKTLYGFKNKTSDKNKSTEKSLDNHNKIGNNRGKMSKEIEEKILDKNFQDIIKCDEILRGKELSEFNEEDNNVFNNQENNKNKCNENSTNNKNNNNNERKKSININKNTINKSKSNNINSVLNINKNKKNNNQILNSNQKLNHNQILNNNIIKTENNIVKNINNKIINNNHIINNNQILNINNNIIKAENNNNNKNNSKEINQNNIKTEIDNNFVQNNAVNDELASGRLMNIGGEMDLSDDLSGSFSAYDNISKILSLDEYILNNDIENENITKYENIKNDFILFYNKEYINSINEEMLILELQLMIDKILEMQNVYKKQSIIIQKNFEKLRKKLLFYQKKNLLTNKKMNKLIYFKLRNAYNEEFNDLYYNNKKISFYRNKNIFRTNELSLWNNLTSYINEKELNKKNDTNITKKKFKNIFLIVCNKNINNLNTLSKKYVLEFVEKEKKLQEEKEKEKEKEIEKKFEKVKLNNTFNYFYNENKKKNELFNNNKSGKIKNKNNFKNNNRNDMTGYKSNKLLKSNDVVLKKGSKKDLFKIQETEGDDIKLSNEKIKKNKFKSNEFGDFNNRNLINKKNFNTMKTFSKKITNKK